MTPMALLLLGRTDLLIWLAVAVFFALLFFVVYQVDQRRQRRLASNYEHWATTEGRITASEPSQVTQGRYTDAGSLAQLRYTYVDGTGVERKGKFKLFFKGEPGRAFAFCHLISRKTVRVYYDPAKPGKSLLRPADLVALESQG